MKSVNLIPADSRKQRGGSPSSASRIPTYAVLGVLAAALALVTVYVLTGNTIASRKAQVASLQTQVAQKQTEAAVLGPYGHFATVARTRLQTVQGIASTRFDWNAALTDLAHVVPANTTLQTLTGTVAPGASAGGGAENDLRSAITTPALELVGCTATQDDVARLMSQLRLIDGVTRVTLGDTNKSSSTTGSSTTPGCAATAANFDMVVFFRTLPGAGPAGATSVPGVAATTTTTSGGAS